MSQEVNILVPDVGDFSEVDVIEVLIKPGDVLVLEQSILTLESDKASMEVPSPYAGVVKTVQVSPGDKVKEGVLVATLEVGEVAELEPSPVATSGVASAAVTEQLHDVRVPDVGDFSEVDVIEVLIKPGDVIKIEQSIITLESDKASMDVPSPVAGVVKTVQVSAGDKVKEGVLLATVEGSIAMELESKPATTAPSTPTASTPVNPAPVSASPNQGLPIVRAAGQKAHASPSVRRFARELGADINQINGSGNKGRIVKEDVQNFIKASLQKGTNAGSGLDIIDLPDIDFSQFGDIETKPLTRLQKLSGSNLHRNWVTIPHITHHDEADITELEAFRKSLKAEAEKAGVKLTFLPLLMKALVAALKAYPTFNASLNNAAGDQLILKQYFHIGVAVDTPDGLVVPVVKNVDQKGVLELAGELSELSGKARKKKLKGHEMQGGTFTISSLGGIGGTSFTPIVNAPEVAILGVSRSKLQPIYTDGTFLPRSMLPLSLSYDHRVNDGAEAARFSAYLARVLTDMRRILL